MAGSTNIATTLQALGIRKVLSSTFQHCGKAYTVLWVLHPTQLPLGQVCAALSSEEAGEGNSGGRERVFQDWEGEEAVQVQDGNEGNKAGSVAS